MNLDFREIGIIEDLYAGHFISKSDPDYEIKKRHGVNYQKTSKNATDLETEQDSLQRESSI